MQNEPIKIPIKLHDSVQEGKDWKKSAKLAVKLICGAFVGVLLMITLTSESTEKFVLNQLQNEVQTNQALADQIATLEYNKAISDDKLSFLEKTWDEIGQGSEMTKEAVTEALMSIYSEHYEELSPYGKSYIPSGSRTAFLQNNAAEELKDKSDIFEEVGFAYGVDPDLLVCIAFADSGLGTDLTTDYNYGNVGNNDRGDRVGMDNWLDGVTAMAEVLNNQYLGGIQTVGDLSYGGGGEGYVYATSEYNWNNNVLNCLRDIKGESYLDLDESYEFRL